LGKLIYPLPSAEREDRAPAEAARYGFEKMKVKPPLNMHSGPIKLVFKKIVNVEPGGELVPFYHFKISDAGGNKIGHINFKVGDTNHIRQCVGHIGYEILPEYQGSSYSYFACDAIRPFIRSFYGKVVLTSDPENIPSIKIIEKLKAKFLNEIVVPKHDPSYKSGSRRKRRYEWEP
jgi:predicted acetyltransferase